MKWRPAKQMRLKYRVGAELLFEILWRWKSCEHEYIPEQTRTIVRLKGFAATPIL